MLTTLRLGYGCLQYVQVKPDQGAADSVKSVNITRDVIEKNLKKQ